MPEAQDPFRTPGAASAPRPHEALFPDRAPGVAPPDEGGGAVGLLTRRTAAAAGLAGVALLAACQTLPIRRPRLPAAAPAAPVAAPPATPTPLPTMSVAPVPPAPAPPAPSASAPATTAAVSMAPTPAPSPTPEPPAPAPLPVPVLPEELLARRATFGPTRALVDEIAAKGINTWLDEQLSGTLANPTGDAVDAAFPVLNRTYQDLVSSDYEAYRLPRQIQARALARATWSTRQLEEVMAFFWANHLNVHVDGDDELKYTRADYDATLRQHTLGKFADMLVASAHHPAMMEYLNLAWSHKDNPNENYAREIMELHTLGEGNGYTQTDVEELSKLLTGWRMRRDEDQLMPTFAPGRHYVGPVTVLGQTFANPDENGEGLLAEVANFLARRPEAAAYIAFKLARHFVADEPPATLVANLAQVYSDNDTAIVPVLRALFTSPEFAASAGGKMRRPYERFVATLRLVAPAPPEDIAEGANRLLDRLPAERPYDWTTPDGDPDVAAAWLAAGTAIDMFNVGARFLRGEPREGGVLGVDQILMSNPTSFDEAAVAAAQIVLLREPTAVERQAVLELLGASSLAQPLAGDAQRQAAVLAASLLLLSPSHLLR